MATEEKENERGFRVADRRRFVSPSDESQASDSPSRSEEERPAEDSKISSSPPHSGATGTTPAQSRPDISFSSFILGLSTQALMYMGEMPPAPGQPIQTDLLAAQQMIDVLAMLKQKTSGNLDAGEDAMLNNALFDLRMRYVELARKGRDTSRS
jgi:hypothetical protein